MREFHVIVTDTHTSAAPKDPVEVVALEANYTESVGWWVKTGEH